MVGDERPEWPCPGPRWSGRRQQQRRCAWPGPQRPARSSRCTTGRGSTRRTSRLALMTGGTTRTRSRCRARPAGPASPGAEARAGRPPTTTVSDNRSEVPLRGARRRFAPSALSGWISTTNVIAGPSHREPGARARLVPRSVRRPTPSGPPRPGQGAGVVEVDQRLRLVVGVQRLVGGLDDLGLADQEAQSVGLPRRGSVLDLRHRVHRVHQRDPHRSRADRPVAEPVVAVHQVVAPVVAVRSTSRAKTHSLGRDCVLGQALEGAGAHVVHADAVAEVHDGRQGAAVGPGDVRRHARRDRRASSRTSTFRPPSPVPGWSG